MKHCDCRSVGCPADFVPSPDTLRALADDHRLCEMPAKFRWSMQWAAAEMERLRLTDAERRDIAIAADAYEYADHDADCARIAATLRGLLERMK